MTKAELTSQVVDMSLKATPPVMVTGFTLFGATLPDVVGLLTIAYLLIHIGYIITKWYKGI